MFGTCKLNYAVDILQQGGLVVFPTETVYGLGANAADSAACSRIFSVKQRPASNPLIVHAASLDMLMRYFADLPDVALRLFLHFSPGPLTIVLSCEGDFVCTEARAGLNTVAVRIPAHRLAQKLIARADCLVAAPSANRSGEPSASSYRMALNAVKGCAIPVLNGGNSNLGIESTIVDASAQPLRILRPGRIPASELAEIAGSEVVLQGEEQSKQAANTRRRQIARAPGSDFTHYCPGIPVYLFSDPEVALAALRKDGIASGLMCYKRHAACFRFAPHICLQKNILNEEHYAKILYRSFFKMERSLCRRILCEVPPNRQDAVYDRLLRAANWKELSSSDILLS